MGEIVSTIIESATAGATGLAKAIVGAFDSLAYTTTGDATTLSTLFNTMLVFVGFSIAVSLFSKVFGLIKSKLRKKA